MVFKMKKWFLVVGVLLVMFLFLIVCLNESVLGNKKSGGD